MGRFYYGGKSINVVFNRYNRVLWREKFFFSKKIVFSQLKYSAYLPEKEWNLSRLCAASDNKKSNSVIRRMADTYNGFAEKYLDISEKIVLKFVSNQILAQDFKESINECKKILDKLPERADEYFKLMQQELDGLHGIALSEKRNILKIIIDDILYNIPMNDKEQFLNFFEEYLVKNPKDPELDVREIWNMNKFLKSIKAERNIVEYKDRNLAYMNSRDEKLLDLLNKLQDDDCVSGVENVLDQIIQGKGGYSLYQQLNYIADFIEEKAYIKDIDNWRQNYNIKRKYYIKFAGRLINDYWDSSTYTQANRIFNYSLDEKFTFMTEFLNQNHLLSADEYVQALNLMAECLDSQELIELLEWMIAIEWEKCCATYNGSAPEFLGKVNCITENMEMDYYIAMFLWRMFGHPDKKNRFRAQHVLWRYVEFDSTILSYFYELYKKKNSLPVLYLDKDNFFLYESAQISFLEASLYMANHFPDILAVYYQFYEDIALESNVQHALKRHPAVKICKKLNSICGGIMNLLSLDNCEKCIYERAKGIHRFERERDSNRNLHFNIDTMDTIRYWYDDVAEIFGCTQGEVAELCDFYIMNELKITDSMASSWQKKYYRQQNHGRASNDHGAIPSYETLRKYA